MKPARVLHVFKYFRPRFTGEGVFVERLAPIFGGLRPDVSHEVLVTATPRPQVPPTCEGLSKIHYLSTSDAAPSQAAIATWIGRNAGRYSVVHQHTHADRSFLGLSLAKLQGCLLVQSATLDDSVEGLLGTYRPGLRPLVRQLFGLIDQFVAISPKLFEQNNRFVRPPRSTLIPMGVPLPAPAADSGERTQWRSRLSLPTAAPLLVSVGGVCARKDQLFLLERLKSMVATAPQLMLVLVGPVLEPDYRAQLDAYINQHGLQAHVLFAGYTDRPGDYYRAADLMVFASREEGFGTVMIEAMAHGLPVVARRLPAVNDSFITHGETGFLFDEPQAFEQDVLRLLNDRLLARQVGARARDYAAGHFDILLTATRYLRLYGYPVEAAA